MKNYILILGIAAVSIGSYCAYAGNSATMTVTATIAHDVSLTTTGDINIGTITINPASNDEGYVYYNVDGTVKSKSGPITAATSATPGTFTANLANPPACDGTWNCRSLMVTTAVGGIFSDEYLPGTYCVFAIANDSSNKFKVVPTQCFFRSPSETVAGTHTKTKAITISYTGG
ncbi:MAG: hypothetical protein IJ689_02650 [Alphaproteobacteria bacterium]|nr:hypothetical protein [Alphaproteobacteria bacterium]